MKGGGDMGNMLKQAKKMQADMEKAQAELAEMEITGESGGGLVSVVMTGKHEVRRVTIDDSLLGEDKDMLEDLMAAAVNDAVQKAEKAVQDKFSGLASGMGLPAGFKLPF